MSVAVHIQLREETPLVGHLHSTERGTAVTFEYAAEWLKRPDRFAIDPASLPLSPGPRHSQTLFGAIADCGPDRWGRLLIERAVRKGVISQKPHREIDYVLALDDFTRLGALRFRIEPAGPFLAPTKGKVPPMVRLQALLQSATAIHAETDTAADLRFLLGAGSPLGGARPKSAVSLPDGRIALAKFPKPDDTRDIAAGEILALELAARAGINVVEHRLVKIGRDSVAVITRFDRVNDARIPFVSGATLLGLAADNPGSYTMLADAIRQFGDDVPGDLHELWRRLIFSLLVSNYDDHLRNHGVLMRAPGRWALSPAYDMNPVPEIDRVRTWKTPSSEDDPDPSLSGTLGLASRFGLGQSQARAILAEVFTAVSTWREVAAKMKLRTATISAYATAFEHELMTEARHLVG